MKKNLEIWAIDENWNTIIDFINYEDLNLWLLLKPKFFQILYRFNEGAIHVYNDNLDI